MTNIPAEPENDPVSETVGTDDDLLALERAVLARLEPDGLSNDATISWQRRKSAQTRLAILDAAVRCLAEKGYAHTTTKNVASMANVSRGAMLHHYPTKRDLVEEVIAYTFFKRMERNFREYRELPDYERAQDLTGVALYWKSLCTLEYRAYLELCVAACTDEELRDLLGPKAAEFEEVQLSTLPKLCPDWKDNQAGLILANDLLAAAMDGLWFNHGKWREPRRAENVRRLVSRILHLLRTGKIKAASLEAAPRVNGETE